MHHNPGNILSGAGLEKEYVYVCVKKYSRWYCAGVNSSC
jgi:hypothetical protein